MVFKLLLVDLFNYNYVTQLQSYFGCLDLCCLSWISDLGSWILDLLAPLQSFWNVLRVWLAVDYWGLSVLQDCPSVWGGSLILLESLNCFNCFELSIMPWVQSLVSPVLTKNLSDSLQVTVLQALVMA